MLFIVCPRFSRFVQLNILSELLEEFEYILASLILHGSQEEWSDHFVAHLDVLGFRTED